MTHHILAFDVNSDGFLTRFARCSLVDLKLPTVFTHEGGYSENHVPYCGLRVVESLCGMIVSASSVKTTDDEEAAPPRPCGGRCGTVFLCLSLFEDFLWNSCFAFRLGTIPVQRI